MIRLSLTILMIISLWSNSANSEPVMLETQPVDGDIFKDHRVEGCDGIIGVGMFSYAGVPANIFELSDICILEHQGRVVSLESRENFDLVEKSKNGRAFAILNSSKNVNLRTKIGIRDQDWCELEGQAETFYYNITGEMKQHSSSRMAFTPTGYIVADSVASPPQKTTINLYLAIRNFTQHGLKKTIDDTNLPSAVDLLGELRFQGTEGLFSIKEGGGHTTGDANGKINLSVDQNGNVIARGRFSAKSSRLIGHEPKEWVEISAEVPYMRGHLLGKNGELLDTKGLVRGSYTDASGNTHSFRATAELGACFSVS